MTPIVDQDLCIGCGTCEALCPEVFKMTEEGKAHVIENVDYKQYADQIKQSVESCPAQAIKLM